MTRDTTIRLRAALVLDKFLLLSRALCAVHRSYHIIVLRTRTGGARCNPTSFLDIGLQPVKSNLQIGYCPQSLAVVVDSRPVLMSSSPYFFKIAI